MRTIWKLTLAALVGVVPNIVRGDDGAASFLEPPRLSSDIEEKAEAVELESSLFSDEQLDNALFPKSAEEEETASPFQLVQREEPFTGTTPEEQVLRQRVQQAQRQGSPYTQRAYSYNQPGYAGANSLLPGYGGAYGFGGFGTGYNSGKRWYLSVAQTADYVTNLALPLALTPLNIPVRKSDAQFQSNIFAQYRIYGDDRQSLTTGFNFYQSLHSSVEQLDLTAYTSITQYTRQLTDRISTYAYYSYAYYLLDNNPFLDQNNLGGGFTFQRNPYVTWNLGTNYSHNNYKIVPTQDSNFNTIQLQRYRYFGDLTQYWFGGYAYGYNDAQLNTWSYGLHNFFLGMGKNFGSGLRNQALIYGSYGYYGFKGPDILEPAVTRQDSIYTLTTRLSRNMTAHSSLFAQYTFFSSDSNVTRQNFESQLVSIGGILFW